MEDPTLPASPSLQTFIKRIQLIFALPLPQILMSLLQYCQLQIKKDFGVHSLNFITKQKMKIKQYYHEFSQAFSNISKVQRFNYYLEITDFVFKLFNGKNQLPTPIQKNLKFEGYLKCSKLAMWKKKTILHDSLNHSLQFLNHRDKSQTIINLRYYLLRKSKNQNYNALVLQACDKRANSKLKNIYIGFHFHQDFQFIFNKIKQSISFRQCENIEAMYRGDALYKHSINSMRTQSFFDTFNHENSYVQCEDKFVTCVNFGGYGGDDNKENQPKQINTPVSKHHQTRKQLCQIDQNISQILCPQKKISLLPNQDISSTSINSIDYFLNLTNNISSSSILLKKDQFSVYQTNNNKTLMLVIQFDAIISLRLLAKIYGQLPSSSISTITQLEQISENTKHVQIRCQNQQHQTNARIFELQRKQLKRTQNQIIYHQITIFPQNQQQQCIYGNYESLCRISTQPNNKTKLVLILQMENKGQITIDQNLQMNLAYINGVYHRFSQFQTQRPCVDVKFFDHQQIKFNGTGNLIISNDCKNNCYKVQPLPKGDHEQISGTCNQKMLTNDWKVDEHQGGLLYLNSQKVAAQKGAIKFIISQIGKNIFSGKSVLNISLPVEIFMAESHLQRLIHSFRMAPTIFEKISLEINKHTSATQVTKSQLNNLLALSAVFGLSTSLLYLSQQKTFNSILGQTSQMWVDGCPVYAEQISQNPTISAIYFVGRGYRIYGQLQSKVEFGLNSCKGSNSGELIIQFDNGLKIINYSPAGQVSGLSYGKRKFTFTGKSNHFIQGQSIYLDAKYQTSNQLIGKYFETTPQQIQHFRAHKKFKNIKTHKIAQNTTQLSGIWSKYVKQGQSQLINFDAIHLTNLNRDACPLPSDSVWRQDIAYRRNDNFKLSQKFKETLEEQERKDKKIRNH